MQLCHKHKHVHDGVCLACKFEDQYRQSEADLQHTRFELIEREKECERLQQRVNHLEARLDNPGNC